LDELWDMRELYTVVIQIDKQQDFIEMQMELKLLSKWTKQHKRRTLKGCGTHEDLLLRIA
jgi:hypothetical protein